MVSYTLQPVLSEQSTAENLEEGRLKIPIHYDKRYRINISVANRDVDDYLKKGRLAGNSLWELISPVLSEVARFIPPLSKSCFIATAIDSQLLLAASIFDAKCPFQTIFDSHKTARRNVYFRSLHVVFRYKTHKINLSITIAYYTIWRVHNSLYT